MSKKIKMRKWFVFSLLFTFLLTISFSNVKAITESDITNLNNTTWTFNSSVDSGYYGTLNNILFEDKDGNVYTSIEIGENPDTGLMYIFYTLSSNDVIEVYNIDDKWLSDSFQTITFKSNITDSSFLSWIKLNATYIEPDPVVTHDIYFSNYDSSNPITASDSVYYQINNDGVWRSIVDSNNTLPRWVTGVSSIQFKNESLTLDLVIYNYDSIFAVLVPGLTSATYTVSESLDLKFILESSDVPDVPTDPDNPNNYIITGGYKFNDIISCPFDVSTSSSYTMDLTSFYNYFPYSVEPEYINYQYLYFDVSFVYLRSSNNSYYYIGSYNDNDNTYIVMNNNNRYLRFDNVSVSRDVYNYLNANGTFGTFEQPQVPITDWNVGKFLLDGLNNFLSFEIYPGFSLISLLNLIVAIPLLIYILKLFLGG